MGKQNRWNLRGTGGGRNRLREGREPEITGRQWQGTGTFKQHPSRQPHFVTSPLFFSILAALCDRRKRPEHWTGQDFRGHHSDPRESRAGRNRPIWNGAMTEQPKRALFAADSVAA